MSSSPPDDGDPTKRERSSAEVDAQFAVIVSAMSHQMSWDVVAEVDAPATPPGPAADARPEVPAAQERERRRRLRRLQRADEVADFDAGRARSDAELQADDAHFVPPEPPPVPLPRRRTVVALLLMAVGLALLIAPGVFQIPADAVLLTAISCLIGGFGMLVYGLRPRAADPDDSTGWDDGARL